jgi:hypothetical protein
MQVLFHAQLEQVTQYFPIFLPLIQKLKRQKIIQTSELWTFKRQLRINYTTHRGRPTLVLSSSSMYYILCVCMLGSSLHVLWHIWHDHVVGKVLLYTMYHPNGWWLVIVQRAFTSLTIIFSHSTYRRPTEYWYTMIAIILSMPIIKKWNKMSIFQSWLC